jgi:hypothetical protein
MNTVDISREGKTRPRRGRWMVFFLILAVLGGVAVIVPIFYNLGLQLKPEDVARNHKLWGQQGTRDYDLELVRRDDQQDNGDEYQVRVRDGRITSVVGKREGIILVDEIVGLALGPVIRWRPPEDLSRFTVEGLFNEIENDQRRDAETASKRNYSTADFDTRDGHPRRYVHRVAGTKQRVEWAVKLTRVNVETP